MRKRAIMAVVLAAGTLAAPAQADVVPLAENSSIVERGSNPWRLYGVPGDSLVLNAGELRGVRDIQGGAWVPGRPSLLNLDIGAGNGRHPGLINVGADLAWTVRLQARGRTVLQTFPSGVSVYGALSVCSPAAALAQICRPVATEPRVDRLERRVRRLRAAVRRLLRGRHG